MTRRRVYGPVPSRRFGLSLGVDLVPKKTCCYDCIYCQVGRTTRLAVEPADFYPLDQILADIQAALDSQPGPEVITLAGSGEPALYRSLGALIDRLHERFDIPVALLTNGALLSDPHVAQAALRADILAPSLDAGDQETFIKINRPHPSIGFVDMLRGLQAVCETHPGKVRIEVMLVEGQNDSDESIQRIAGQLGPLRADSIDINTPVRPAPGGNVVPCGEERLEVAARAFGPSARIITGYRGRKSQGGGRDAEQKILDMLSRRPCTIEDIHASLGIHPDEAMKVVDEAARVGKVRRREERGKIYYFCEVSQ